jgi:hydroxyacylglutathione hydrolase
MFLKRFYDEQLAHASYLVGCYVTGEALVVDPNRNIEQYLQAAATRQCGLLQ